MKLHDPVSGERCRVEQRLFGAFGLAEALQHVAWAQQPVQPFVIEAIADALAFHLEQLCKELGLKPDTEVQP